MVPADSLLLQILFFERQLPLDEETHRPLIWRSTKKQQRCRADALVDRQHYIPMTGARTASAAPVPFFTVRNKRGHESGRIMRSKKRKPTCER